MSIRLYTLRKYQKACHSREGGNLYWITFGEGFDIPGQAETSTSTSYSK